MNPYYIDERRKKMNDKQITQLLNKRDEKALNHLEEKYSSICMSIARNILGNVSDAEECVNDTYLAVWNSIPPNHPDSLIAYVCRIVKNLSLKKLEYNTAQKRNSHYDKALDEICENIGSNEIIDEKMNVEILTELINKFLDDLDRSNRVMFVRRYWYCDSISDIAKMFHVRENTVSVKLSRMREKLRSYLEEEGINI